MLYLTWSYGSLLVVSKRRDVVVMINESMSRKAIKHIWNVTSKPRKLSNIPYEEIIVKVILLLILT